MIRHTIRFFVGEDAKLFEQVVRYDFRLDARFNVKLRVRMMMAWIMLHAKWKHDSYMVVRVRRFLELNIIPQIRKDLNLNEAEITDTLSTGDDEMPRISVAMISTSGF